MLLLILAGFLLVAATVVAVDALASSDREGREAVRIVTAWAGDRPRPTRLRWRIVRLQPVEEFLLIRSTSARTRSGLRERLAAAGVGDRVTPADFVSIRFVLVVLGAGGGLLIGGAIGTVTATILLCVALAVSGYVLPGVLLDRRARARRERIDDALPDALDLLAVTVEAGLGLYGAIAKVVESTQGPLADEFALCLAEMRVGESSSGALKRLGARTGSSDVRSMARTMIQGEELGLSLAKTLRGLADDARRRRHAAAEERAAKAPVKMLFPAALFIFPALFIVILGPAVLTLGPFSADASRRVRRGRPGDRDRRLLHDRAARLLRADARHRPRLSHQATPTGCGRRCRACRSAMVRAPTPEDEDSRRVCRERKTLTVERIQHINRIKGLLFSQGVSGYEPLRRDRRQRLDELKTGDGRPLPPHLKAQISRELDRLELLIEQIKAVEAERDVLFVPTTKTEHAPAPRTMLIDLRGIGPEFAAVLWSEGLHRSFANRKQVASYAGLAPTPWQSGSVVHEQGISKAGNPRLRTTMI